MNKKAVLALGGNAIIQANQKGTITEQFANTRESLSGIVELIKRGYLLAITHGNGPQVGNMLMQQQAGQEAFGIAQLPLGVLNAATEGSMGYMIEQSLQNRLLTSRINKQVITIISQVVVDKDDPSIQNPTKPVGPFYDQTKALEMQNEYGWVMKEDAGRGWRHVVPSPIPKEIVNAHIIKELIEKDNIVIACGGGGIPVYVEEKGTYEGVDAVIDKDFASALLARKIDADLLVILTGVDRVSINFGKPDQKELSYLNLEDAKKYLQEGHFPAGSMGPKIAAAIGFIENGGKTALITSLEKIVDAFEGKNGTLIER